MTQQDVPCSHQYAIRAFTCYFAVLCALKAAQSYCWESCVDLLQLAVHLRHEIKCFWLSQVKVGAN